MLTVATPSAPAVRSSSSGARPARFALIASLPFSDFLQTGIVAFSAAPLMGELGASPEEYSAVAMLYAVVAIGVIACHRQIVERLGWRRLLLGSSGLFGVGAWVCAGSGTLTAF